MRGKGERVEVAGSPPVRGTRMRGKGERVEVAGSPPVPGTGMRGKGEGVEVAGRPPVPGTGMRGKGERVEVALLPLGAELPAGSPTCRRAGPSLCSRASGQGGAAAEAEAR